MESKATLLASLFALMLSFLILSPLAGAQSTLNEEMPFGPVLEPRFPVVVEQQVVFPELTCRRAPCVLPVVNASGTPTPANETPLIVNSSNSQMILAGANDYGCADGNGFYATTNGGQVWNRTCMNALSGYSGLADPIVAFDLNGNAFIGNIDSSSTTSTIALEESSDGGTTWSAPFPSVEYILPLPGLADKPWLAIDTNAASNYVNSLYISTAQFDQNNDSEIAVSGSHDGGQTWQTVPVAPEQMFPNTVDQFTAVAVGSDGTVYVTWQRCAPNGTSGCGGLTATFYMVKSSDGGATWTDPTPIFTAALAPDACGCGFYGGLPNTSERVNNIPTIAVDDSNGPYKGYLYVVYYNWTGTYMQVRVATSVDGGNTWTSAPVAPASDTHDQFSPWLTVSTTGVVGVSWMDRRNDKKNVKYQPYAAFSTDGGATFGTNYRLSKKLSNPFEDGFHGQFFGDYTGASWGGTNTFYAVYTDTTTGRGQAFVGGVLLP